MCTPDCRVVSWPPVLHISALREEEVNSLEPFAVAGGSTHQTTHEPLQPLVIHSEESVRAAGKSKCFVVAEFILESERKPIQAADCVSLPQSAVFSTVS